MAHLNIASLPKHIDELRLQLTKKPLDILSINETRLDDTINDSLVHLNGYDVLRKDRNRMGGGVAITINRNELVPDSLEALCVEVRKPKSKPILIVSCYRSPNSDQEVLKLIENLIRNLDDEGKELVILGDFNYDLVNQSATHNSDKFLEILNLYQLHQLINEPTRITETSKTLIDVIITNKPVNYLKSGISDHSLVYTCRKLSVPKSKHEVVVTRCLKKYNSHEFNEDLKCNFENFDFDTSNPNDMWESWKNIFNVILEKHATTRIRKVRSEYAPWLTNNIKKNMYHRDYLKKMAIKHNFLHYHEAFRTQKTRSTKL